VACDDQEPAAWNPFTWRSPPGYLVLAPGVNGDERLTYIDLFAWAARHEQAHHRNFVRF